MLTIIDEILNKISSNKVKMYLVEIYIDGFWFTRALVDNGIVIELVLPKIVEKIGAEFVWFEDG